MPALKLFGTTSETMSEGRPDAVAALLVCREDSGRSSYNDHCRATSQIWDSTYCMWRDFSYQQHFGLILFGELHRACFVKRRAAGWPEHESSCVNSKEAKIRRGERRWPIERPWIRAGILREHGHLYLVTVNTSRIDIYLYLYIYRHILYIYKEIFSSLSYPILSHLAWCNLIWWAYISRHLTSFLHRRTQWYAGKMVSRDHDFATSYIGFYSVLGRDFSWDCCEREICTETKSIWRAM